MYIYIYISPNTLFSLSLEKAILSQLHPHLHLCTLFNKISGSPPGAKFVTFLL